VAEVVEGGPVTELTRPRRAYVVCATPRTGSTLLCDLLERTGVAGRPREYFERLRATGLPRQPREYLDGLGDLPALDLLAPTEPGRAERPGEFREHLVKVLRDGTTPNGVFATKVMWGHLDDLAERLCGLPECGAHDAAGAIAAILPDVRYVHVTRRDKVAQAISLWTALQTGRWSDEGAVGAGAEPVYSFSAIDHLVRQISGQERAWERWFGDAGAEPVEVVYEEMAGDPRKAVLGVLDALAIDARGVAIEQPRLRRQSDGRSREWAERFAAETLEAA
jgi:LPS sulfotransferase NodH